MPTREQMENVRGQISHLESLRFIRDGSTVRPVLQGDPPEESLSWGDLADAEKGAMMGGYMSWEGFSPTEELEVVTRVLDGQEPWELEGQPEPIDLLAPIRDQIDELAKLDYLGFTEWKDDRLLCEWHKAEGWDDTKEGMHRRSWPELDERALRDVLNGYVDWAGIDAAQKEQMIVAAIDEHDRILEAPEVHLDPETDRILSEIEAGWKSPSGWESVEGGAADSWPAEPQSDSQPRGRDDYDQLLREAMARPSRDKDRGQDR